MRRNEATNGLISRAGLWNTKLKAASPTNECLKGIVHPKICTAFSLLLSLNGITAIKQFVFVSEIKKHGFKWRNCVHFINSDD